MSEHRVPYYRVPESDLDSPGVVGRRVEITSGGSAYSAGDQLVDTGSSWELIDSNYGSVKAEKLDNSRFASAFDGADGGEQIQNAIDDLPSEGGTVVVGPKGPDAVTEETGNSLSGVWGLSSAIELPNDTTLLLNNSYVILKSGADTNIIRNANLDETKGSNTSDTWANENIRIQGIGQPTLDGNGANQTKLSSERWRNVGLRFTRCKEITIDNVLIRSTQAWGVKIENFSDIRVSNIQFRQRTATSNRDGVDLIGKGDTAVIENIYGQTGDDIVAVNASQGPSDTSPIENDNHGRMYNIDINTIVGTSGSSGVKLFVGAAAGNRDIDTVNISDVSVYNCNSAAINLGPTQFIEQYSPDVDSLKNVNISNVTDWSSRANAVVKFETPGKNINISNVTAGTFESGVAVVRIFDDGHVQQLKNISLDNISTFNTITDTVKVDSPQTVDGLSITGVQANHDADTGDVIDIQGTVTNLYLNDITVEQADRVFNLGGNVSGRCGTVQVTDSNVNTVYGPLSNLKFFGTVPAFDSSPPNVLGTLVAASPSWDPDGDSNGEYVMGDGTNWNEVVDLPGWT